MCLRGAIGVSDNTSHRLIAQLETLALARGLGPTAAGRNARAPERRDANEDGGSLQRLAFHGSERGPDSPTGARDSSKYLDVVLFAKLMAKLRVWWRKLAHRLERSHINMVRAINGNGPSSSGGQQSGETGAHSDEHQISTSTTSNQHERNPNRVQASPRAHQKRLIGVLSRARTLNAILFVGYSLAFIGAIDHESLGRIWAETRSLTFQNFQSRVLHFTRAPSLSYRPASMLRSPRNIADRASCESVQGRTDVLRPEMEPRDDLVQGGVPSGPDTSFRATSWPRLDAADMERPSSAAGRISGREMTETGQRNSPAGASKSLQLVGFSMRYYLLIATLVDILANRDWRRLKSELAALEIINGRQFAFALKDVGGRAPLNEISAETGPALIALARLGPLVGWISSAFSLLLSSPKHLFQFAQVALLTMFPPKFESPFSGVTSLMAPLNALNQMVKFALGTYQAHCYLKLARADNELAKCEPEDLSGLGWNPFGLRRYLMISQIFYLKLTIMVLLVHLDSKPIGWSLESVTVMVCLAQTLYVMFVMYTEYQSLYSSQAGREDGDKLKLD